MAVGMHRSLLQRVSQHESRFHSLCRNQIASGLTTRFYGDVTVSCATTYYYLVEAVDSAGAPASAQVSTRTGACPLSNSEPGSQ